MTRFGRPLIKGQQDMSVIDAALSASWISVWRKKKWAHFAVIDDPWIVSFAVVNVGYLGIAWVQAAHLQKGIRFEHHLRTSPQNAQVADSLFDTNTVLTKASI